MQDNQLHRLEQLGQSVWADVLNRDFLASGTLARLIAEDGVSGVTSNPKTFADGVFHSHAYDADIHTYTEQGKTPEQIYEALAIEDIRSAADLLLPVYARSYGRDGFVSLEVSPRLAYDADETIAAAHRLWAAVDRPNLLIKVPATLPGIDAIRELIAEGINVNVTLLFGLERFKQAAQAYVQGLTRRAQAGKPVNDVTSVASFFLSRIDVLADSLFDKLTGRKAAAGQLIRGQVAIASARLAAVVHREIFSAGPFLMLRAHGARPQKLLWASTSAKRPEDGALKYVEPLIGPDTITTLPLRTLDAYRESGKPAVRLCDGEEKAERVLQTLTETGITADDLAERLEEEGVRKFADPYNKLIEHLEHQATLQHA